MTQPVLSVHLQLVLFITLFGYDSQLNERWQWPCFTQHWCICRPFVAYWCYGKTWLQQSSEISVENWAKGSREGLIPTDQIGLYDCMTCQEKLGATTTSLHSGAFHLLVKYKLLRCSMSPCWLGISTCVPKVSSRTHDEPDDSAAVVVKWALECKKRHGSFRTCAKVTKMAESFDCSSRYIQVLYLFQSVADSIWVKHNSHRVNEVVRSWLVMMFSRSNCLKSQETRSPMFLLQHLKEKAAQVENCRKWKEQISFAQYFVQWTAVYNSRCGFCEPDC